jgi:hypothetical protein
MTGLSSIWTMVSGAGSRYLFKQIAALIPHQSRQVAVRIGDDSLAPKRSFRFEADLCNSRSEFPLTPPMGLRQARTSANPDCRKRDAAASQVGKPPILTLGGHGRYAEFSAWRRAIKDASSDSSATAKPSQASSKSRRSSFVIPFFGQAARERLAASENPIAQSP